MEYRVTKMFSRGPENGIAEFASKEEAIHFIQEKLSEDARFKVNASYRLYDFIDLIKEYTQTDLAQTTSGSESSSSSGGKGSTQTFSPTPFNAAPRPAGMPQNWVKDEGDDKTKK